MALATLSINLIARDVKGRPHIAGTKMRVSQIAIERGVHDYSPEDILESHPHLTLAQIHAALAYYYENKAEIAAEIETSVRFAESSRALAGPQTTRAELEARRDAAQ